MADSKISDLPESSNPNPLSKVITAYNGQNYQVPLTSLVSSASAPKFVFYLNSSGTANNNSSFEDLNLQPGQNDFQIASTRFNSFKLCMIWIRNNLGAGGGLVHIIFETNISDTRGSQPMFSDAKTDIYVFGNKVVGEYFSQGVNGSIPSSSNNPGPRLTYTLDGTAHQNTPNFIDFWFNGRITFYGLKFDIKNFNNQGQSFGLFRFSYRNAYSFFNGVTVKVATGNNNTSVPRVIEADGGAIFCSSIIIGSGSIDILDSFFSGNSRLAAFEFELAQGSGVGDFFSVNTGALAGVTEFGYMHFGVSSYTANARIHFINSCTMSNFVAIQSGSEFSTNGMCVSKASGVTVSSGDAIEANAFNTLLISNFAGSLTSTSTTTNSGVQRLPGTRKFGSGNTAGQDYIIFPDDFTNVSSGSIVTAPHARYTR
jgi:hypothetical protein